jgi:hypothetical protein
MAISPIFRDIELQNEFDRNGFVKVAVFSESQVNEFKNFYQNNIIKDSKNYVF